MRVIEYYCFFIIIIVGPPNLADPVWPLKKAHFSKFDIQILHPFDGLGNPVVVVVLEVFFASIFVPCVGIPESRWTFSR